MKPENNGGSADGVDLAPRLAEVFDGVRHGAGSWSGRFGAWRGELQWFTCAPRFDRPLGHSFSVQRFMACLMGARSLPVFRFLRPSQREGAFCGGDGLHRIGLVSPSGGLSRLISSYSLAGIFC